MHSEWPRIRFGELSLHSAFGPRFSSKEYDPNGNIACLRTKDINLDGRIVLNTMPLALLDESKMTAHYLQAGDLVFQYTDGVTEARCKDGSFFTLDRLCAALRSVGGREDARSVVDGIFQIVADHVGEADPHDDMTVVCLKRLPD